ncbi:hypothetical protein PTSG_01317 [Salpingoeca rosetta]|uniref:protein-tyrosine-phosphatase n=1 Tax=Salpingoeca rosetta (strain ATCC 50818 / BSB-021) TaxID=946362 RepID=F2TZZ9_SALR5|nr:uncharacterized protein PTSG_01317 [Salpingoeca rosetta]EGD80727.1 hypothetical protein PTSG_01317 [Salpingoeca rosetta]|eukprot:XP_004997288.1 hypothetical protein PTSG_01317 [Salpingoeca rosetta]
MGQDQSMPSSTSAVTAQEFVEAMTGQKLADEMGFADFDPMDLIPGVTEFTPDQVSKLDTFLTDELKSLRGVLRELSKNRNSGFLTQFQNIKAGLTNPADASRARGNEPLNRYANIVAYDHSRVTVSGNQYNLNNDYVNANWIPGKSGPRHYIASQGPVPDAFPSFWQMVWENQVSVIVMVTNEVENGKLKCHRYWPEPMQGTSAAIQCGGFEVTFVGQDVLPTFVLRTFSVKQASNGETREVVQFAYTGWPDHGVPATTKEMINFRRRVKEEHLKRKGPLLTHCSAGVGRTGTFIGLDRYLDACLSCQKQTILGIVEDMRHHRNFMVQSPIQFVFLYLACLDGLERMQKITTKAKRYLTLTADERRQEELAEVTAALEQGEKALNTWKLREKRQVPAAGEIFKNSDDPSGKTGYFDPEAPTLKRRMEALNQSRVTWNKELSDAQARWQKERGENGEVYNIEETMAPMQSRLAALAEAQAAFQQRATGDAQLVELKDNIASVQNRLESLCVFVYGESWKKRGHGFRGKGSDAPVRSHTTEMLGTLQNRLEMLARDTTSWLDREFHAYQPYTGPDTFQQEVQEQRALQEKVMKQRMQEQQEREQRAQQAQQDKERMAAEAKAREEAERKEREQREQVKEMFAKVPDIPLSANYDPAKARAEKQRLAELELKKQQEQEAAAKAAEEAERLKLEEKEAKKEKAKKKASRFLGRLRK